MGEDGFSTKVTLQMYVLTKKPLRPLTKPLLRKKNVGKLAKKNFTL